MCKMRGRTQPQLLLCDFDYARFTMLVSNRLQGYLLINVAHVLAITSCSGRITQRRRKWTLLW